MDGRTDGQTTDAYPWQKLTWPMARWAKKKQCHFLKKPYLKTIVFQVPNIFNQCFCFYIFCFQNIKYKLNLTYISSILLFKRSNKAIQAISIKTTHSLCKVIILFIQRMNISKYLGVFTIKKIPLLWKLWSYYNSFLVWVILYFVKHPQI